MIKLTTFLNSSKCGDIIYGLTGMKSLCEKRNTKARLYLRLNVPAINTTNGTNYVEEIMLTDEAYNDLRPLLMAQDFIEDVREYKGEPIDINLDAIRQAKIGLPHGSIKRWYSYLFPEMHTSYDDAWLKFTENKETAAMAEGKIIVSLSNNYRNHWINYEFLNICHVQYEIIFIGLQDEAQNFINKVPRAKWLKCDNFNDIAVALSHCKCLIGNQNAVFAVAEGLKIPRLLEICYFAPNVIPDGKNGYDYYLQNGLEWYLKELLK